MEYTCEAQCQCANDPTKTTYQCGKNAPYTCIYCNKHFCIDCMYLLCSKCHMEISCFWCGCPIKHQKNYCSGCQSDCQLNEIKNI